MSLSYLVFKKERKRTIEIYYLKIFVKRSINNFCMALALITLSLDNIT